MAKNLRKFTTEIEYSAATLNYPSVSWVTSGDTVHYDKRPPFKNYFRTVSKGNGNIKFTINSNISTDSFTSISYSTDSGSTWTTVQNLDNTEVNATVTGLTSGDTVYWKGDGISMGYSLRYYASKFSASTDYDVEGNIMSLLYGDNFESATTFASGSSNFVGLFNNDTHLINASGLTLPATTLANDCYYGMFEQCPSLTTAPALPATTLARNCYRYMFKGCTSLTTAPALPAISLAEDCYSYMFKGCTSLATAPALPAMSLAEKCYDEMFEGCTSLTTAPSILPATTLAPNCYISMFNGCTSLTTAPELPATNISQSCYANMFQGCTSLTTAPVLSAATLKAACYANMFQGCTSLSAVTCLATNISAINCTNNWLNNVSASGVFTKDASMTGWTTGDSGIPSGWTTQNYGGGGGVEPENPEPEDFD